LVNKDLTDTFMPRLDCCVKRDKPFQFYGRCNFGQCHYDYW